MSATVGARAVTWLIGLPVSVALHLTVAVTAVAFLRVEPSASGLVVDLSAMSPQRDEAVPAAKSESRPETPAPSEHVRASRDGRRPERSAPVRRTPVGPGPAEASHAAPPARDADLPPAAVPPSPPQPAPPADAQRTAPRVAAPEAPPMQRPSAMTAEATDLSTASQDGAAAATSAAVREGGGVGERSGAAGASAGGGTGGRVGTRGAGGGDRIAAIGPGTGDGLGTDYGPYKSRLRQRIQETLRYPAAARRRGVSGTVQLEIAVQPDGSIGTVTVVASSSHEVLDRAAVDAVRSLPPVPFPADVRPTAFTVRLPVVFELQDR